MSVQLGLIGFPLQHSESQKLHEHALLALNLEGSYRLWEIKPGPDGLKALASRVQALREGRIQGLNVTIPYKEIILPLVDSLSPAAQAVGAVNTLYREPSASRVVGHNTDSPGFWKDLQNLLSWNEHGTQPSALILGAGGAARAVTHALTSRHWTVTVAARRPDQAERLAADFQNQPGNVIAWHLDPRVEPDPTGCRLIVNATPVGTAPETHRSPWPEAWTLPADSAVYDLVYHPRDTLFMKQARKHELPVRNGLGMLVEQAALAFSRWTGQKPPRDIMRRAVR